MPRTRSTRSASAAAAARRKITGYTPARLFPEPLRPLNRSTSHGYDVADFAEIIGQPLTPWQRWAVIHAMEILPDGRYRFRIVLIMVARQNGKSHLQRIVTLWRMLMDDDCKLVLGTAQDLPQASNQWKLTLATIQDCPWLAKRLASHRHVNGQESLILTNRAEYMVRSASENAGRGFSVDHLIIDELRTQKDWRAWAALSKTVMARPNPQIWCMSNAGDDSSVVLNALRDSALASRDHSTGLFEWSAEDGCELDDVSAWRQANPGLGITVSADAIRTSLSTDPPALFRTEVLCQRVESLDSAVDLAAWRACADPSGTLTAQRGRLAACLDVAPDGQHVTLAAGARLPDGRVRGKIAGAWNSTDAARAELGALLDKLSPAETGWFPSGPAAALAPILRHRRGSRELKGAEVTEACQGLADLATARQVIHNADPLLDAHISAAQKLHSGDGWRFTRKEGHVDAAYAFAGMVHVALTMPEPQRARIRILG